MTAYKNSGKATANHWRNTVLFALLMAMLVGAFVSRAALSVTTGLFITVALLHKDLFKQVTTFFRTPYWLFFSFLFFIPFLSGLWSSNLLQWSEVIWLKMPLLLLPLAVIGNNWSVTHRQWRLSALAFLFLLFVGCAVGLIDYALHASIINESYLRAKTILTPFEDDHVRYSWLVGVGIVACLFFYSMESKANVRRGLLLLAGFFAVYLHILSARTGLLCFYFTLLLLAGWFLIKGGKKKITLLLLATILLLPMLAYLVFPTFKARYRYVVYDLAHVQKQAYLPGTSDGARVASWKAGWFILQQHPLGVGAGDIQQERDRWYAAQLPQVLTTDKMNPCSEWLMYGGFAGWPAVVLFCAALAAPHFMRLQGHRIYWTCFHAIAAISFTVDMGLEVQYGIFWYAFISAYWYKWLVQQKQNGGEGLPA